MTVFEPTDQLHLSPETMVKMHDSQTIRTELGSDDIDPVFAHSVAAPLIARLFVGGEMQPAGKVVSTLDKHLRRMNCTPHEKMHDKYAALLVAAIVDGPEAAMVLELWDARVQQIAVNKNVHGARKKRERAAAHDQHQEKARQRKQRRLGRYSVQKAALETGDTEPDDNALAKPAKAWTTPVKKNRRSKKERRAAAKRNKPSKKTKAKQLQSAKAAKTKPNFKTVKSTQGHGDRRGQPVRGRLNIV